MLKGFKHIFFKKGLCCLVFLFSFLFSFSSTYQDHHVYQKISDESSINSSELDYSEFTLCSQNHLSEYPENRGEGENGFETEKETENEKETDDDKDESLSDSSVFDYILYNSSVGETFTFSRAFFSKRVAVPFYILFHSWKSHLA